ncbi:putative Heat shock protein 70 family [Helianthus annuus]|nr:putative Heat shock protein 70 family [Helianthus annuus]
MSQQKVKGAAIGIDLGTTYSCAAVWFDGKNRVEVIPNEQGNNTTPSCVAFNDTELLVGEGAKNQIARNPTNTVFDVKRLIGCRFHDPQVQRDMESWPFKIVEGRAEKPNVVVELKGEKKKYTPEELSAMVLKDIKEYAEAFIGREVTDAVITVPAYFNNNQRESTKEAGALAGLNVLQLINEPTTAAIAYGLDHMADQTWHNERNVLVFDLGGGTFDVSLLKISKKGLIDVKAVGGDTHLGGEDFDMALVNYCIKEFEKKHKEGIRGNPRAMGRLKVACEKAKRDLSSAISASIDMDCLYEGNDFSIRISRAKFEELNSSYFEKCIELVEKCLLDGEIKKNNVDEVVIVGGSTRIPKIQRLVEDFFDGKTLCKRMNGDEAIASGAALLAARLSGGNDNDNGVWDIVLQDVTPLSLGIATEKNGVYGSMAVVIPRNTSIPTCKKEIYYSRMNKTSVVIFVYQGENIKVKDNILLGKFRLDDLTLGSNGMSQLEIWFNIDANGILVVSAQELSTGQSKSITIAKT